MKTIKIILLCYISLFAAQLVTAQTAKSVFETSWQGYSSSRSDITESGVFMCKQELYNVSFDESDNTFTGISKTIFNLEGTEYMYKANVKGTFYESDFTVVIQVVNRIDYDFLPDSMYWVDSDIFLSVFLDADHEGYYIMSGQTDGQSYSDELFQIGNYPY
jgi:hypothetical protein